MARSGPRTHRRTDTDDPSRSRQRALRVLFQADLRGVEPSVTLTRLQHDPDALALLDDPDALAGDGPMTVEPADRAADEPSGPGARSPQGAEQIGVVSGWSDEVEPVRRAALDGFTRSLVLGVEEHRAEIEALITRYSRRWAISRMPLVDRNVLRLATYELLHESTPPAVVLDEAISLAKQLSTDDSGRFVNGVLESIRRELATAGEDQRETGA